MKGEEFTIAERSIRIKANAKSVKIAIKLHWKSMI